MALLDTSKREGGVIRRVVDVGAGNGAFAAHPAALGYQVTTIEPSATGMNLLRKAHLAIDGIQASAYDDLSPPHGLFDAAVALEVVEHCYYPRAWPPRWPPWRGLAAW